MLLPPPEGGGLEVGVNLGSILSSREAAYRRTLPSAIPGDQVGSEGFSPSLRAEARTTNLGGLDLGSGPGAHRRLFHWNAIVVHQIRVVGTRDVVLHQRGDS